MEPARVHLTTYGCQMNRLDAELAAEVLRAAGARIVADPAEANVLVLVTCSVRAHAENRVFSNVGALAERKKREPDLVVGLVGCMAQAYGEALWRRAPLVDFLCAPGRLALLPDLVEEARAGRHGIALDPRRQEHAPDAYQPADARLDEAEVRGRTDVGPARQAFVRVMRGCDRFCSYCVVPYVRGPERSRSPAAVLEEVRRLAERGVREVTLLGQAVNHYAFQEAGRSWDLSDLIARVAETPNLARLRFITSHPGAMTPRLAACFRDVPNLCPHLHMPAQSGSDTVLARMNRGYTAAEYAEKVALVHEAAPDVAVVSDFIVGFPGETREDFEATLDLARRMRFAGGFVFKYSPRPGTVAAEKYSDDVPRKEKERRHRELLDLLSEIAMQDNQALIGREVCVLVEGPSPRPHLDARVPARGGPAEWTQWRGRTPDNRLVVFDGRPDLAGELVTVRITRAGPITLFAALLENGS
ncbi:MAG: tRNA (N6-isopentenyl adenosine(37)-C2)-methylthiotransferase MiaB [Phycisphaerae bacterium]|nr:tRNA (N6-isopentenyl adenosine(37)-C2)-methylthiotransferase MiaB [Phycisphaerae bacterium]